MDTPRAPGKTKYTPLGLRLNEAEARRLEALLEQLGNVTSRHKLAKVLLLRGLEWMEKEGLSKLLARGSRGPRI